MDRGRSPTVRKGSAIPFLQSEPSLTVGLLPRAGQHNFGTLQMNKTAHCRLEKTLWLIQPGSYSVETIASLLSAACIVCHANVAHLTRTGNSRTPAKISRLPS